MAQFFRLPDLGEGVHEGEVLAVHVAAGDQVNEGDVILEVETDKAAVEIPSPFSGRVSEIRVKPGDVVRVGDILIAFDGEAEVAEPHAAGESQEMKAPAANDQTKKESAAAVHSDHAPVPASPATRRLARELGVDLNQVTPTGHGGVVTADDLQIFARGRAKPTPRPMPQETAPTESPEEKFPVGAAPSPPLAASPLPDFSQWGDVERIPFRSIRRATARQMVTAWTQIPHVNSQDNVDITRLEAFRSKHKADIEAAGGRLTLTVFALKAVATALKAYPQFNASLDVEAQEIILKRYFHIGVAVNTEHGLIVPVIRDVDRKSIKELAVELNRYAQRTRERQVARDELRGGTFTITNAGAMGGGFFTPIINHPEVAILGMGQARLQPVVRPAADGSPHIEPRLIMPLVLCIDHRVLDGADAIRFLQAVIDSLEDPDELLMTMT